MQRWISPRGAALAVAALAGPAAAQDFACTFTARCNGVDRMECETGLDMAITLKRDGTAWIAMGEGKPQGTFLPMPGMSEEGWHFTSTDIDSGADARAMLSIFHGGAGYLTLHGDFMTPLAMTFLGTCTVEGG